MLRSILSLFIFGLWISQHLLRCSSLPISQRALDLSAQLLTAINTE